MLDIRPFELVYLDGQQTKTACVVMENHPAFRLDDGTQIFLDIVGHVSMMLTVECRVPKGLAYHVIVEEVRTYMRPQGFSLELLYLASPQEDGTHRLMMPFIPKKR